ncbi:hypothetical protein GCM10028784_13590 [Myceligenerans cantabricum]
MATVASPSPSAVAVAGQASEPSWYYIWDVAGTWFGAIGTFVASVIALWLGLRAVREQRELQEERNRAQAERVTLTRQRSPRGVPILTVRNDSDLAISGVRVGTVGQTRETRIELGLMAPGREQSFRRPDGTDSNVSIVEFVDAAGRTWVRSADGDLHRPLRRHPDHSAVFSVIDSTSGLVKEFAFFPHPTGKPKVITRKQPMLFNPVHEPLVVRMVRALRMSRARWIRQRRIRAEHGASHEREDGAQTRCCGS